MSDGFAALATLGLFIKPARKIAGFPSSIVHQQFVVVAVYLSYLAVQRSLWVRSCLISRACHRFCVFTCPRQVQRQFRPNVCFFAYLTQRYSHSGFRAVYLSESGCSELFVPLGTFLVQFTSRIWLFRALCACRWGHVFGPIHL